MDTLVSDAIHVALGGGSRSGKTFLLVRAVLMRAVKAPGSRHVIFRFRFNALKASVILDTLPKVLKLCFPELPSTTEALDKTDWYYTLPGGSEIWFAGLDDKDRTEKVLGMEFATIYYNEASQIPWHSVVLSLTRLAQKTNLVNKSYTDFNPPSKNHWTYTRFIDKKNPEDKTPEPRPQDFSFCLLNPSDNTENLDSNYLNMLESLPEKARKRFLLGQFADESEHQLWTESTLAQNRVLGQSGSLPDFLRVVIGVDPSGTKGDESSRSDEVGIIVGALGVDGHGYVLEDLSGKHKPEVWGSVVATSFERHKADRVVAESNYGGDMVRAVIHAQDSSLPYQDVTATRGKVVRAEPIAALYEQNKIHHVGHFAELEDQMLGMLTSGYSGLKSPDRVDALVWVFTELFPGMTQRAEQANWTPPQVITRQRSASRYNDKHMRRI